MAVRAAKGHRQRRFQLRAESLEDRRLLAAWEPMGPAPIIDAQVEKVTPQNEASGAIHALVAHPTDPDILYIGSVNGGIWRTNNATADRPTWVPLTDDAPSLSIGSLAMDPTNADRLVAGSGRTSAFGHGGVPFGLILTEDGGDSWRIIDDPLLVGRNISGLVLEGDRIVAAAGGGTFDTRGIVFEPDPGGGLFASEDEGVTWRSVELLPRDPQNPDDPVPFEVFDLVVDPNDSQRLYASVAGTGVFASEDGGRNWQNVTAGDALITAILTFTRNNRLADTNWEMAVASDGRIYTALIVVGQPVYIGYSDSFGRTWTQMDIPLTQETPIVAGDDGIRGLNPRVKPGGQGYIHFSMVVDPSDPKTVYVGGDSQDGILSLLLGNSLGARNFTGKLFRGDTRFAPIGNVVLGVNNGVPFYQYTLDATGTLIYSPQWEHLTHSNLIAQMPGGGTRRSSAPHADSRDMVVAADGELIEVSDGGIYRRTRPKDNLGDWYSLNGNLQVTEFHNIEYDSNANILLGGTQDNGTVQQVSPNSKTWQIVRTINQDIDLLVSRSAEGDGGDVAVDDTSLPGFSFRYTSGTSLGGFRRQLYDTNNVLISETELFPPIIGNFITPVELNSINQRRLVVGGSLAIYESLDRGGSFTAIPGPGMVFGPGISGFDQNAIAYGGKRNGVANPDVLYVGTVGEVFVRTQANGELRLTSSQFPGGRVRDIVLDANDWMTAFVIDRDNIYMTSNAGASWIDITGDLQIEGSGELRTLEFINSSSGGNVILGTERGVFIASPAKPTDWQEFGDLPNAPVFDLEYDATDDVLVAGTLGRGAFMMRQASRDISQAGDSSRNLVTGIKWHDLNGNGLRDPDEPGIPNVFVYVDTDGDNRLSITEPSNRTDSQGRYVVRGIPNGTFAIREITPTGWVQTFPNNAGGEHIAIFAGTTEVAVNFANRVGSGVSSGFDFGDAPSPYPTAGVSHAIVAGFHLGATVDGESGSVTDDGDDGVKFEPHRIFPGGSSELIVTISNRGNPPGYLQGWIDFNGDGNWSGRDEQIFTKQAVHEGQNKFALNVPRNAVLGPVYARFRYGYESNLSFTGAAFAGEIEDYELTILSSGPTASDNSFEVRENSRNNSLNVVSDDTAPIGGGLTISAVSPPNRGGTVVIGSDQRTLSYTPAADFWGTESFTYTVRSVANGETDTATVTINVLENLARISLVAANVNGTPVTQVAVGEDFVLQGIVKDLRDTGPTGVFAAYLDIIFPGDLAAVRGPITYGIDFPNNRSGDTSESGLIDEVGAIADRHRLGEMDFMLFRIPLRATQAGTLTFVGSAADILPQHSVLLFDDDDPVPFDQIEYGTTSIVVAESGAGNTTNTNPVNALDVNSDSSVTPIDALIVINELNSPQARAATSGGASYYVDVNADGGLSPIDALLIINYLNREADVRRSAVPVAAVAALEEPVARRSMAIRPRDGATPADGTESPCNQKPLADPQAVDSVFDEWDRATNLGTDSVGWSDEYDV